MKRPQYFVHQISRKGFALDHARPFSLDAKWRLSLDEELRANIEETLRFCGPPTTREHAKEG